MRSGLTTTSLTLAVLLLAGCAANPLRQYDSELQETVKLVKQGSVKQAVAVLESMKMEISVLATEPGTVTQVLCAEGKPVQAGDALVVIKP